MFPDVLQALFGRAPDSTPATAPGWRVATLPDRVYPGLVPSEGSVNGLLIIGLTPDEWRMLDAFEDDVYELRRVTLMDGREGWTYVCSGETEASARDWDAKQFAAQYLAAYVKGCIAWRRRYDTAASKR